ncbi:2-(1,2-epoxy-1,2-dihydrophenyl)acetyl-CoA isomerase PaaG [Rhizobium alvei]|uniref:2-(1,2-epoxy-1,2-dihydrophenyl)acetyl-CoA isomerase PaaG n=1 Tax=Rhizobium alvei TaxID=1132659 RepID=A0ABT8YMW9_9HYPH|nr:2-(1,2-epoxy-1,2-dihydrophenyl)acetyl-CoA isomerase PaaG [Rhizobium alvei]MDO6965068.1 2-(1,2-epoxy-1,2-dihydrophenyl)acetyl-CoA isomerase PaaG [Rhizobium alvei]
MEMTAHEEKDVVLVRREPGYVVITLNRPDKLNAFTVPLHRELKAAFDSAAADPDCRAIALTGAGRGFCAGQDLKERKLEPGKAPDLGLSLETYYNPLIMAIRSAPKPVLAAVNGVAAGAGANLALACDIVIAARSARFIQSFSRIGLVPDAGGSFTLPRLIGEARARALAILAEPVSAGQALDWGMIWDVVDDDVLLSTVETMAADLAQRPTQSFALMKQAFNASAGNDLAAQLRLEAELQRQAGQTEDYMIGVEAFKAGTKPQFKGR